MKKKHIFLLLIIFNINIYSQEAVITVGGSMQLDPSNWLTAIDNLYASYDMVANTLTQIENQYRQIQQAINAAKSIDWSSVSFDGDFDIRDDIKRATKKVNKALNCARSIKETITTPCISAGGFNYSIADLCGANGPDHDFVSAAKDIKNYITTNMEMTINNLTSELTEGQKKLIWKKYGISPKNYMFVQQSISYLKEKCTGAINDATEKAKELYREEKVKEYSGILSAMSKTTDENGNITEGAIGEASVRLSEMLLDGLIDTKQAMDRMASIIATEQIAKEAEKQANAAENEKINTMQNNKDSRTPDRFKKE